MNQMEYVKAFFESRSVMELPAMPAVAFINWKAQCEYLSKHIVTGHFSSASTVRIRWVGKDGSIRVVTDECHRVELNNDAGYRTWNLGNILDGLTPGETIYWTMEDNWGAFCMGAVKIGGVV